MQEERFIAAEDIDRGGTAMHRTFNFGKIDFLDKGRKDCPVGVVAELKDGKQGPVFLAVGTIWNQHKTDVYASGQCLDIIAKHVDEMQFVDGELFKEIHRYWLLYNGNDMHSECIHQADLGWPETAKRMVIIYNWKLTREAVHEQRLAEKAALDALKAGKRFTPTKGQTFFAGLAYRKKTWEATLPADIAPYYEPAKPMYEGDWGHEEARSLGQVYPTEHPLGVLAKPCPICGYRYGTGFNYFSIPDYDLKRIKELLAKTS